MRRAGLRGAVVLAWLAAVPAWGAATVLPGPAGAALLSETDRQVYAAAFEQAAAKRFDRALDLAREARDPLLAKVLRWRALIEPRPDSRPDSRPDPGASEAAAFLRENPDWPGQAALRERVERALPADLPEAQVLAWFRARPPVTAGGALRYAEALIRAGQAERAAALVRATWVERDLSAAEERDLRARFDPLLRREDEVARLDRLLWDRQARAATRQAQRLGGGYPALAEARLRLARDRPGVDAAIRRVPGELREDPGLRYERARWRQRRGRYADVIELLDPPRPQAPRAERWWPLRHWAARRALENGDISVAYRIAAGHGMDAGLGFAEAEWLAGWIALRFLAQPLDAYQHFERLHAGVSSPISLARSAFWAGEAAHLMDRRNPAGHWHVVARQWYAEAAGHDTSFYGQLAHARLGRAPVVDLDRPAAPSAESREAFAANELVRIVRMLGELGEAPLQERFLLRLQALARSADDYALLAELSSEQNRPDLALRAAKKARSAGIILPGHLFPGLALAEIAPPELALVLSIIRQESEFHPEAVSRAGARGLMQIRPPTAKQVARQINLPYSRAKLTSDPDYNVRLGRAYLSDLLERFGGSYVLALVAYNAGPGRTGRWIEAFGDPRHPDVDVLDWIESIPLDETRNYVQRILEGLVAYRQRLGVEDGDLLWPPRPAVPGESGLRELPSEVSCCL